MMKKRLSRIVLITLAIVGPPILAIFAFVSFTSRMWEATLHGPFTGRSYSEELDLPLVSKLSLPEVTVEIYQRHDDENPVLICKNKSGEVISRTLLTPELTGDGEPETTFVKDVELIGLRSSKRFRKEATVIQFLCDWGWGGKESGLILLNEDHSFKEAYFNW